MPSLIYGYGVTGKSFEKYLTNSGEDFDIFDSLYNDSSKIYSKIENKFYKNIGLLGGVLYLSNIDLDQTVVPPLSHFDV